MYSGSITPEQLSGRDHYIIADLKFGNNRILAATKELAIPWGDRTICVSHYLSRPIEVKLSAGWGKSEHEPSEASIEIPVSGLVLEYLDAGAFGAGVRCEVFLWIEGSDYEAREVLVIGQSRVTSWGAPGEALVLSIKQDQSDVGATLQIGTIDDSEASVPSTESSVPENLGRSYPIVFGVIQTESAIRFDRVRRSEALAFSEAIGSSVVLRLVVAGHQIEATEVVVFDSDGTSDILPIVYRQDGVGRTFATVNLLGSALNQAQGTTYTVKWSEDGGALVDKGQVLYSAGHLVEWIFGRADVQVDWARVAAARSNLDSYRVAGTIQEPVSTLGYCGDAITSVLPATLTSGPSGWWVWPWPLFPKRSEAIAVFDPRNGDVAREGELVVPSGDVVNEILISFGIDQFSGEATRSIRVGGIDSEFVLEMSVESQRFYGIKSQTIESVIIEDPGCAHRVASARLAALAIPKPRISYSLSPSYAWLRPRQIVEVYDEDVQAYGVGVVDSIMISETSSSAEVILLTQTTPT